MNAPIDISAVVLQTERLTLRPWRETDLEDFYAYASVDGVGQMAGWTPHKDKAESQSILSRFIAGKHVFALEHRGRVIGSLGLHKDEKRPGVPGVKMVGYVLAKDSWGQGRMTEAVKEVMRYAFEEEGLRMLTVYHFPWNDRSRRVIEKCGFRKEGTLRESFVRFDGTLMDEVCYSLTAEEWQEGRKC